MASCSLNFEQKGVIRMEIVTQSLVLRPLHDSDLTEFYAMHSDAEVMRYYPSTWSEEQCREYIKRQQEHHALESFSMLCARARSNDELVGVVGLQRVTMDVWFAPCVEIGWRLRAEHWHKGLATEASRTLLEYAFTALHLEEVFAFTSFLNTPSEMLMQRLGMEYVGEFMHPKLPQRHILARHMVYRAVSELHAV